MTTYRRTKKRSRKKGGNPVSHSEYINSGKWRSHHRRWLAEAGWRCAYTGRIVGDPPGREGYPPYNIHHVDYWSGFRPNLFWMCVVHIPLAIADPFRNRNPFIRLKRLLGQGYQGNEIYGWDVVALTPEAHDYVHKSLGGSARAGGQKEQFPNTRQRKFHLACRMPGALKSLLRIF